MCLVGEHDGGADVCGLARDAVVRDVGERRHAARPCRGHLHDTRAQAQKLQALLRAQ